MGCGRARCSPSFLPGAAKGDAQVCRPRVRSPASGLAGRRVRASARRAAVLWGAPRAFGVSVYQSKQAERESSKGTQTYFCHGNSSLSEVPSVSAGTWEWSVQVECWLDCASDVHPPHLERFLHFILECVCGGAKGSITPSFLFLVKVECSGKLFLKGVGTQLGGFSWGWELFI